MVGHVPAGAKVVIEPVVPDDWATDVGLSLPWTPRGDRWYRYPTWLTDVDSQGRGLPGGQRRYVLVDQYERTLRPGLLDEYVNADVLRVVLGRAARSARRTRHFDLDFPREPQLGTGVEPR